jgi:hypothetical protein
MTVEHDLVMKDLNRKVKQFIEVFGKEEFYDRYEAWSKRCQIKIGWTCLPTNLANRLHSALEKALADMPPETISSITKPERWKTGAKKPKVKPAASDSPRPATSDMEVGTW